MNLKGSQAQKKVIKIILVLEDESLFSHMLTEDSDFVFIVNNGEAVVS